MPGLGQSWGVSTGLSSDESSVSSSHSSSASDMDAGAKCVAVGRLDQGHHVRVLLALSDENSVEDDSMLKKRVGHLPRLALAAISHCNRTQHEDASKQYHAKASNTSVNPIPRADEPSLVHACAPLRIDTVGEREDA